MARRPTLVPKDEAAPVQIVTIGGREFIPLADPETVAELTTAEVRELEAINALIARVTDEVQHAQRIVNVANAHRMAFLTTALNSRTLPGVDDLYGIDHVTGAIQRTHLAIPNGSEDRKDQSDEVRGLNSDGSTRRDDGYLRDDDPVELRGHRPQGGGHDGGKRPHGSRLQVDDQRQHGDDCTQGR